MVWVSISGLDGSGKTTVVSQVTKMLEAGYNVLPSRPNYANNSVFLRVCEELWGDRHAYVPNFSGTSYVTGLTLDWYVWASEMRQALLSRDQVVVTDRGPCDLLAQGAIYGANRSDIEAVLECMPSPDIVVWLKLPAQVASGRLDARGDRHSLEADEWLVRLDAALVTELARCKSPVATVDATAAPEKVVPAVALHVDRFMRRSYGS